VAIVVRTARSAQAVTALETITHRLQPELGIIDAGSGRALAGVENIAFEVMAVVAAVLGVLALLLAMVGLYGVLSYVVVQRTHEIGIRLALGASSVRIIGPVVLDGLRPVVEGLIAGFVLADLAAMATRPAFTTPLPAIDATLLSLVPVPFLAAALLASYVPARRASRVSPNAALRQI
jgi:ABC-type antimicrobial peptide transport system permease subunit